MEEEIKFYVNAIATPMASEELNKKILRITKKRKHYLENTT